MQRPSRVVRTASGAPPRIPDLATLTKKMFDAGIPLLGVSLTPSFRTLPRPGSVNKPSIGLAKRDDVKAVVQAVGLPLDGYLPNVCSEEDAFRRAVAAIIEDRDFKRSGYFIRADDKAPKNLIQFVVVEERARGANLHDIDYGTAQYIKFDRDTRRLCYDQRDGHRIVSPDGIIRPHIVDWWNRFLECLTTEDVSHMVASYIRYYCGGVSMRKGGGQYFIPKTEDTWPMNGELALVQEFCDRLKTLGEIGVIWSDFPIPDADSVRANMTHHVREEISGEAKRTGGWWAKAKEEIATSGRKLRSATGEGKIAELAALERRCELYINLGLVEIEQQRTYVRDLRLEMKKELSAAVRGEKGETITDLLSGLANDVYGEGRPERVTAPPNGRAAAKIEASDFTRNGDTATPALDELLAQFEGVAVA